MNNIPVINRKKVLIKKASDNSWIMKFKNNPITAPMTLNTTSYGIIELIDGKRSINDITQEICKRFNKAEEKIVEKDIMKLVTFLWNFKVLDWLGDDPFENIYKFKNEKYCFALARNYKNFNLIKERKYTSPYINPKVELSIDGIEYAALYTNLLCFTGSFNNDSKSSIEVAVRFSKIDFSITLEALNIDEDKNNITEIFSDLMKYIYNWSKKVYNCVDENNILVVKAYALTECTVLNKLGFNLVSISENDVGQGSVRNFCKLIEIID